jgi:peptidoglycan-associated lipoprotein
MSKRNQFVLAALLSLMLAGCGGHKSVKGEKGGQGATASGLSEQSGASGSMLGESEKDLLKINKIYFDFDSSAIDEKSRKIIQAHAQFLIENPDVKVVLEGHTDERGTREYNLALGERRANAVAEIMEAYGVAAGRIQTISYGEERPAALGHDEAAWRLNRRVVILR